MKVQEMISLAGLARRADISAGRARRLVEDGILVPDICCGRQRLFSAARLPLLLAIASASAREIRDVQCEIIRGSAFHKTTNQP